MHTTFKTINYYGAVFAIALALGVVFAKYEYNAQGGLLLALLLIPGGYLLIRSMAKAEEGSWFVTVLVVGLALKLGVSLVRMFTNISYYGGLFDAGRYYKNGVIIAEAFWKLDLSVPARHLEFSTPFVDIWTGPGPRKGALQRSSCLLWAQLEIPSAPT